MSLRFGLNLGSYAPLVSAAERWREAEECGVDWIGISDTPLLARDVYVACAVAASVTKRALLSPLATNPLTRHPSVTAAALASIADLAPRRTVLGIGTGDSAVYGLGGRAATIEELREYITAIRDLLGHEVATWQGQQFQLAWRDRPPLPVPIYATCHGPKAVRMAAGIADGIVSGFGVTESAVSWFRETVEEAAREVGRDPASIDLWWHVVAPAVPTEDEALAYYTSSAHLLARHGTDNKFIPPAAAAAIREMATDQSPQRHGQPRPWRVELARTSGADKFLIERAGGLFGPPEQIRERLEILERRGVSGLMILPLGPDRGEAASFLSQEVVAPYTSVVPSKVVAP